MGWRSCDRGRNKGLRDVHFRQRQPCTRSIVNDIGPQLSLVPLPFQEIFKYNGQPDGRAGSPPTIGLRLLNQALEVPSAPNLEHWFPSPHMPKLNQSPDLVAARRTGHYGLGRIVGNPGAETLGIQKHVEGLSAKGLRCLATRTRQALRPSPRIGPAFKAA
ncbi:hypothetical protein San01_57270 [Streptomyces angustmyceticus]|uniref:Uncharacterized protein n=1 Tax=Streptomyces angustmyceticus TaxID=285578 RepID=A0A5J4LP12_9ACTN|nr:hypothetical protein San01_57270 [Streptomyces angustmyceticus]